MSSSTILPKTGQLGVFAIGSGCLLLAAAVAWLLGVETKGQLAKKVSPCFLEGLDGAVRARTKFVRNQGIKGLTKKWQIREIG
jgi:hypothetical protein